VQQLSSLVNDEIKKRGFSEKEKLALEEEITALRRLLAEAQAALRAEKERYTMYDNIVVMM
jgi:hypothetical protein